LVEERVDRPVDRVFHESPETKHATHSYVVWTLLKNPLAVIVGTARLLSFLLLNLRFTVGMIRSGKASNLTLVSDGWAQGRRAARILAETHDTEWDSVNMSPVERAKQLPRPLSVLSWFVILLLIVSVRFLFVVPFVGMVLTLGSFGFAIAVSRAVGDQHRPARDERMFENITSASEVGDHVVLITGENHVKGVASHAAASSVEYDACWLSATADLTDEPSN
jgi:hypothetical protein